MGKATRVAFGLVMATGAAGFVLTGSAATAGVHGGTAGAQTLRFDVKFSPFNLIDVGAKGLSDGDEIVFHDQLLQRGHGAGDEVGSCVITDQAVPLANCSMVIRLRRGNVTAQFVNSPPPAKQLAITGGTGIYRASRGEGTLVEAGDGTGTLTLVLLH